MINWKRLLKRHLKFSKNNRPYLTILNSEKYNSLYSLTNTLRDLEGEDILNIVSLQDDEKFYDNCDIFDLKDNRFDFNSSEEQYIYYFNSCDDIFMLILEKKMLFSPILLENEDIPVQKCQCYSFKFVIKKELYQSENIFPVENKYLFKYSRNNIHLQDKNYKLVINNISIHNHVYNYVEITIKDKVYFILFPTNASYCIKDRCYYKTDILDSNIISNDAYGIVEKNWKKFKPNVFKRIVNNFRYTLNSREKYKEIIFYLVINNVYYNVHLKQNEFKLDEVMNKDNFYITIKNITNGIPTFFEIKLKNKFYNVYTYKKYDNICINFFIITDKYRIKLGHGFAYYKNFNSQLESKLKKLYNPIERPSNVIFQSEKYPVSSILTTILCIVFVVLFIISFIVSIYILVGLSTSRT